MSADPAEPIRGIRTPSSTPSCHPDTPTPRHPVTPTPSSDCVFCAIADAAHELNDLREAWLNPPDASAAELKKRTLTNLYNARPAWLAAAHAALDRAVWAAYGWEDDPKETTDEEILGRLLALNGERAASNPGKPR